MSKKAAVVTGTLRITTPGQLLVVQGTLVEQTGDYVILDVKRRGSKKTDRTMYAAGDIRVAWISEAQNETYLSIIGESVEEYPVELVGTEGGYFNGMSGESAVLVAPGTWQFLPDVAEDEEAATPPKPAAKPATAKAPAAKPAKAEEPEEEEEEEQEEPEAYEPSKGDYVTVTDADEEETTGEVEAINAKSITVAGTKFTLKDVTVVQAEQPEADDTPEEEEYEPADGDYVKVTDAEDEVVEGTITGLTAKKVTIEDAEGESHDFLISKVTIEAATKPKKAAAKPAASKPATKPAAKDEAKPSKPAAKPKADDSDW